MAILDIAVSATAILLSLRAGDHPQLMTYSETAISNLTPLTWMTLSFFHAVMCCLFNRTGHTGEYGCIRENHNDGSSSAASAQTCSEYPSDSSASDSEPPVLHIYLPAKNMIIWQSYPQTLSDSGCSIEKESRTTNGRPLANSVSNSPTDVIIPESRAGIFLAQQTIGRVSSVSISQKTGDAMKLCDVGSSRETQPTVEQSIGTRRHKNTNSVKKVTSPYRKRFSATVFEKRRASTICTKCKPIARLSSKFGTVKETRRLRALQKEWDFVHDSYVMKDDCLFPDSEVSRNVKGIVRARRQKAANLVFDDFYDLE